jgi:polar amino acid transport system substrate-binding protein
MRKARGGILDRVARAVALAAAMVLAGSVSSGALAQSPPGQAQPGADRELVIGTKEAAPFAFKSPRGSWRGISIDLWRHIAERLNLNYRFAEAASIDDLIDGTASGRYDAAIAAITITSGRAKLVDFGQPFYETGLGIAVPAAGATPWNSIKRIFLSFGFLQAISLLLAIAICVGILVWAFERRKNEHYSGGAKGLGSGVWWSAIAMTQAGAAHNAPTTLPGRILAIAWMIASVVTIAVFTAGLTSSLTRRQIQGIVQSQGDLRNARVGVVSGTAGQEYLLRQRIRNVGYKTADDGLRALEADQIDALVYDKPLLSWFVLQGYSSSIRVLDVSFAPQNYALAFPKGSPLRAQIDLILLDEVESPWWEQRLFQYLGEK